MSNLIDSNDNITKIIFSYFMNNYISDIIHSSELILYKLRTTSSDWKHIINQLSILRCVISSWKNNINEIYKLNVLIKQLINEPINAMNISHSYDTNTDNICNLINIALNKKKDDRNYWNQLKRKIRGKHLCINCNMLLHLGDESCTYCSYRLIRSCDICTILINQPINLIITKCNECIISGY